MKINIKSFISGVIATSTVVVIATTALAVSGTVNFSTVNIKVGDTQVASAGDTYTLGNGAEAPYSISYVDENGGSTTYVPIRKFSELVGVDVGWDNETSSVVVGNTPNDMNTYPSPIDIENTTNTTSNIQAPTSLTYKDFYNLWSIINTETTAQTNSDDKMMTAITVKYVGQYKWNDIVDLLNTKEGLAFSLQFSIDEIGISSTSNVYIAYMDDKTEIGYSYLTNFGIEAKQYWGDAKWQKI
jgi:hypothetical protein